MQRLMRRLGIPMPHSWVEFCQAPIFDRLESQLQSKREMMIRAVMLWAALGVVYAVLFWAFYSN
jgi:hypothetical protein